MWEQIVKLVLVTAGAGVIFIVVTVGLIISDLKNDRWFSALGNEKSRRGPKGNSEELCVGEFAKAGITECKEDSYD